MQEITYFKMAGCPYCRQADGWLAQLMAENAEYRELTITEIDENVHPEIANKYDYYYVPTFYVGKDKLHEGAASYDKIKAVLDAANL